MMQKDDKSLTAKTDETTPDIPKTGWNYMGALRDEMNHFFDDFHRRWPFGSSGRHESPHPLGMPMPFGTRIPAIDVIENDDHIEVKAELPGMDEKDISVELSNHRLIISGEKKEEREEGEKEGNYYMSERRYGSFRRTIPVPENIDAGKIDATFSKGVLTVALPISTEAKTKTKKIKIKTKA